MTPPFKPERLMTPAEVAAAFRVDPKTIARWAKAGKLTTVRTLGGHRRYRESEVHALLHPTPEPDPPDNRMAARIAELRRMGIVR